MMDWLAGGMVAALYLVIGRLTYLSFRDFAKKGASKVEVRWLYNPWAVSLLTLLWPLWIFAAMLARVFESDNSSK
jgi:hypothetical protein